MTRTSSRAKPKLFRRWVFGNTIALFASILLSYVVSGIVWFGYQATTPAHNSTLDPRPQVLALGLLLGLVLGLAQWDILRAHFRSVRWWWMVTTLGSLSAVAMMIPLLMNQIDIVQSTSQAIASTALFAAIFGFWVGLWQALVLKRHLPQWRWWVVASSAGMMLASEVVLGAALLINWINEHYLGYNPSLIAIVFILGIILLMPFLPGLIYGLVTGIVFCFKPPTSI